MPAFRHDGHRLAYTVHGRGDRVCVLLPGLLLSQRMQEPLARALAAHDNRVVTFDFLGHGRSDRPVDMGLYSMTRFARQAVALLDHLEVDEAVLAGTSLGANATLEVAALAPERLRGMIVEMPVLDNALLGCALAFTPLMVALTFGERPVRLAQAIARRLPRPPLPFLLDVGLDWVGQDPAPGAAVIQGLFFGRTAPPREDRRAFDVPTLVIGHHRDPVHPFSDAGALCDELPNARLIEASSILELRLTPERLTDEIAAFVEECWAPRATSRRRVAAGA